jgi:predicted PurR-regulated permease PerM
MWLCFYGCGHIRGLRATTMQQQYRCIDARETSEKIVGTGFGRAHCMSGSATTRAVPAAPLWVLATIATVFFLRYAAELLIPIVLAVLISYMLEPVVDWLTRHRVPRLAATCLVLLALLGSLGWGAYSLRDDAMQAIKSLPEAARRAREMILSTGSSAPAESIQNAAAELRGDATNTSGSSTRQQTPSPTGGQQGGATSAADVVQRAVGSVFALAGHITVIVFLVFFLLFSGHHFRTRVIEVAGPSGERQQTAKIIIDEINAQIQRFLLVRLITAVVVGVLTWVVLAWMGVQNAAIWGALAGLFNSIPYFGPVIVSGGLFVVGLTQGGGVSHALQMAGAALVITSLEGWLLTPPLMGKAERMSVLAVFLGLLLWTWIWGAWGTLLAVPMLVIVKAVADHVPRLKPIGRLMAP